MADAKPLINPENIPTIVGVTFVLALLAVVFGFYDYRLVGEIGVGTLGVDAVAVNKIASQSQDVEALQKRVAALEASLKAVQSAQASQATQIAEAAQKVAQAAPAAGAAAKPAH